MHSHACCFITEWLLIWTWRMQLNRVSNFSGLAAWPQSTLTGIHQKIIWCKLQTSHSKRNHKALWHMGERSQHALHHYYFRNLAHLSRSASLPLICHDLWMRGLGLCKIWRYILWAPDKLPKQGSRLNAIYTCSPCATGNRVKQLTNTKTAQKLISQIV